MEKEKALEIIINALDFAVNKGGFTLTGTNEVLVAIDTLKKAIEKKEDKK